MAAAVCAKEGFLQSGVADVADAVVVAFAGRKWRALAAVVMACASMAANAVMGAADARIWSLLNGHSVHNFFAGDLFDPSGDELHDLLSSTHCPVDPVGGDVLLCYPLEIVERDPVRLDFVGTLFQA